MKKFNMGKYKTFFWKGVSKWHDKAHGVIVTADQITAEYEARKLGIIVTYFKERPVWMLPTRTTKKIKIIDIVLLMRQLSTLIAAGVPLVQSLEIVSSGAEKVKFRALILTIRDDISGGKTFSESLAPYPYYFNSLICGLISAGEQSGTLDRMVNEIANHLEHAEYLKNRVKRAMYYPATMMTVALCACLAMLLFLVPRFEKIYHSFNAQLPGFTQTVVNLSHIVQDYWYLCLIGVFLFAIVFERLKTNSIAFQRILNALSMNMILFGLLVRKAIISRICSTLAITLSAGIPLVDALARVATVANNHYFSDAILHTREQVMQGESISLAMKSTQLFPPMVTQMVEIGEKSGALEHMFGKAGEYYRDQVNTTVEGLTTLIEPLLIVILGIIIGVFVIAMYLPIFRLGMTIKA